MRVNESELDSQILKMYRNRLEATARDDDDNVIGAVWKDTMQWPMWNYFYEPDAAETSTRVVARNQGDARRIMLLVNDEVCHGTENDERND